MRLSGLERSGRNEVKLESGKLWLEYRNDDGKPATLGPLSVPNPAKSLLQVGWEIGCALARVKGGWRIIELGSVPVLFRAGSACDNVTPIVDGAGTDTRTIALIFLEVR